MRKRWFVRWTVESMAWDALKATVLPWLIAHKSIGGGVMAVVAGAIAWVRSIEPVYIAVVMVVLFAGVIWAVNGLQWRRESKEQPDGAGSADLDEPRIGPLAEVTPEQPAELSPEDVSARRAFIAQARAALEQLDAMSDGQNNRSIYAGFHLIKHATDPLWNREIKGPTEGVERLAFEATGELLERHHQSVAGRFASVSGLSAKDASPDIIRQICNGLSEDFLEYQHLLSKLATLSSQYSGRPDLVWNVAWQGGSGRWLSEDYAELVRRLKDLRSRDTPSNDLRQLLPKDHNMRPFDELYRWSA